MTLFYRPANFTEKEADNMKKRVFIVADYFIDKNNTEKVGLTNKKLQKLLYYAQAWSLVVNNKKLFEDDIEAWIHGPAISSVYSVFKKFGFENIVASVDNQEFSSLSSEERKILDTVWEVYGKKDANYLELLTHNEDPWIKTRNSIPEYESSRKVIPPALMKEYYGRQIQE